MINIKRGKKIPVSLEKEEIKDYLLALAEYSENKDLKEKPKQPISYRNSDLLQAFDDFFFSKCYLTEEKFANSYAMDVEHFIPKSEKPELTYEWTNLYPASHYANMRKPNKIPKGGYLDPCNPLDDVENEIIYSLDSAKVKPSFDAKDTNNLKAVNTAELLNYLHNGNNKKTASKDASADLRFQVTYKANKITDKIIQFLCEPDEKLKEQYKQQLKLHLSKESSFTMLCRSMPSVITANKENKFFE